MSIEQIIVLALIQGITEYLPVSSSGHLILVPAFTGWPDQGVLTDAITNLGTLLATTIYFWKDVLRILQGSLDLVKRQNSDAARLATNIIIGTIPIILLGLFFQFTKLDHYLRSPFIVAFNSIVFGMILYAADAYGLNQNRMQDITPRTALFFGLGQMLALNPGTSRSGITITVGRGLGFLRSEAARFSFLLSIPANLAGSVVKIGSALKEHQPITSAMIICGILTFFVGLGTITLLMRIIRTQSFLPFVIYRVILGGAILGLIYSGVTLGKVN